jgi:hypothetical protein
MPPPHPASLAASRFGRFRFSSVHCLAALVLLFITAPLIDQPPFGDVIESLAVMLVLLTGVLAVGARLRTLLVAILLSVPALAAKLAHVVAPSEATGLLSPSCGIAFVGFVFFHLLRHIVRAQRVDADAVCAGISAYLLIGLAFMFAYLLVERIEPGSITGPASSDGALESFEAFYFSFATLTTVGYGDFAPASSVARALAVCEALAGVLVLATLISRLVAAYAGRQSRSTP